MAREVEFQVQLPRRHRTPLRSFLRLMEIRGYLLVLPLLALFLGFFVYPITGILVAGFYTSPSAGGAPQLTLAEYARFFDSSEYVSVLFTTFRIVAISTAAAMLIGYPTAYFLTRSERELAKKVVLVLMFVTLFVGGISRNYAWLVLLVDGGPVVQFLRLLGAKNLSLLGTETGVMISLTQFLLPYATLSLIPSLKNIDRFTEEAALSLGATGSKTFVRITLPQSLPGIVAAVSLSFSLGASAFVTPLIIGSGVVNMLSNFVYTRFVEIFDYPFGSVLSTILLVTALFFAYVVNSLLVRRFEVRRRK